MRKSLSSSAERDDKMADVYISFAPQDAAKAHSLQKELNKRGLTCRTSGIHQEITREIQNARFFVVLVSRNSIDFAQMKQELYLATEADCKIFPIRLDNKPLNDTFVFYLGAKQWITAGCRFSNASKELCDAICREQDHNSKTELPDEKSNADHLNKHDKGLIVRLIILFLLIVARLVIMSVNTELILGENLDLFWDIDIILDLILVVAIFLLLAPCFGGYKVFLRTVLEEIRDAMRGK